MTLLVESFLLSFKTFLRYLIVMPFVVIPAFLIVITLMVTPLLLTRGLILIVFLFAPILFSGLLFLIFGFLFTAISSFNIMVGCRAAFGAMGRYNDLDFGRLVGKSFAFTFAQMAAGFFIVLILGGIVAATALMGAGQAQISAAMATNPALLADYISTNALVIVVLILSAILSLCVSAVLAVPMAGAAISATPKMGPTDAFLGIGTAFVPILVLLILVSVGLTITGAYGMITIFVAKLSTTLTQYMTDMPLVWPTMDETLVGVGMFLFVVWTSCWFYAAAALGWQGYSDDRDAIHAQKVESERFSQDELRAFREMRDKQREALA